MGGRLSALLLRDVELAGRRVDVRIAEGWIAEIATGLRADCEVIEGDGGALIPGLADHHIHLLATAAARASVALDDAASPAAMAERLRRPGQGWLRATGFHEHRCGELDRAALDRIAPDRPLRVQHQTGAVWFLNSAALALLDLGGAPEGVDAETGRVVRADGWLRAQLGGEVPDLAPVGQALAAVGVTSITDASVTNDHATAAILARAVADGTLPERVTMMSGGELAPRQGVRIGPVKILPDDHNLPTLDDMAAKIADARRWGRRVAVHCVTTGELALTLAAFEMAGSEPGDRVEHGGVIPEAAVPQLARLGLTVVTQSAFPFERGDRYLAEVDPEEIGDLYRCASLRRAGVPVAGSSDAPYAGTDPWAAMRAAVARRTATGQPIGPGEAIDPHAALGLYLGAPDDPGGAPRRVEVGAPADLCLLHVPLGEALSLLSSDAVAATIVDGIPVYRSTRG